jgi:hypothetical protein
MKQFWVRYRASIGFSYYWKWMRNYQDFFSLISSLTCKYGKFNAIYSKTEGEEPDREITATDI